MNRYTPEFLLRQGKSIITAHSGCEGTPDNSREHILAAIASGAEMIEIDVRRAKDGTLFLSHDETDEIGGRPLLSELFERIAPEAGMGMNLDLKTDGLVLPVLSLAAEYGLSQRIVFTGACGDDRALIRSHGAEMWRTMWPGDCVPDGIAACRGDGSPFLNVKYTMVTDEYRRDLRAFGADFSVWTVNTEEGLRRFLEMGVANITTRIPCLAMRLRKEIQGV